MRNAKSAVNAVLDRCIVSAAVSKDRGPSASFCVTVFRFVFVCEHFCISTLRCADHKNLIVPFNQLPPPLPPGATGHLDFPVRRRRGTIRAHEGVDGWYHGQGRALLGRSGGGLQNEARGEHDYGHHDEQLGKILLLLIRGGRCRSSSLRRMYNEIPRRTRLYRATQRGWLFSAFQLLAVELQRSCRLRYKFFFVIFCLVIFSFKNYHIPHHPRPYVHYA